MKKVHRVSLLWLGILSPVFPQRWHCAPDTGSLVSLPPSFSSCPSPCPSKSFRGPASPVYTLVGMSISSGESSEKGRLVSRIESQSRNQHLCRNLFARRDMTLVHWISPMTTSSTLSPPSFSTGASTKPRSVINTMHTFPTQTHPSSQPLPRPLASSSRHTPSSSPSCAPSWR